MNQLFTILFIFVTSSTIAQQRLSKSTQQLSNTIAARNVYESERVGFAASPSVQYKTMKELKKKATVAELIFLVLNHKNSVVKVYAWEALQSNPRVMAKDKKTLSGLESRLLQDTTQVSTLFGCIGGKKQVRDLVAKNSD